MKLCGIRDCENPPVSFGLCSSHAWRLENWGHPLRQPIRRKDPLERFLLKFVLLPNGCWQWRKPNERGYGVFWNGDRSEPAYRWAYEFFIGPLLEGQVPDHLCRNRACVNPTHLEAVTVHENWRRGESPMAIYARRTHCAQGHEFTPENTRYRRNGARECLTCKREINRIWMGAKYQEVKNDLDFKQAKSANNSRRYERHHEEIREQQNSSRRAKAEAEGRTLQTPMKERTHCPQGHPYEGDNLLVDKDGRRRCRICTYGKNSRAGLKRLERLREEREAEGLPIGKGSANAVKTHCPYGHEYTPENTIIQQPSGARACRECSRIRAREYRAKKAGGHADAA